jgi:hypothetical protein
VGDFWTELAQSLRTADRVLAGLGPERAPDPIPLWHDARTPPPEPGRYLVIARLDDGSYEVQRDRWRPIGWHGEGWGGGCCGDIQPGSVVAWAEEP